MALLTSPTIEDLILDVRYMLNQPDPNNSFWQDEEIAIYLNEGIRRYFADVIVNAEGQFVTQTDLNLVADQETVDLPADFFQVRALYRPVTDGYQILPYQNNLNSSYSTSGNSSGSYFPSYYLRGNKLVLREPPNFSETSGLRLEYVQFPETLVTGGDSMTSQVSPVFKDLIETYAVYKAKLKESLVNGGSTYQAAQENLDELYTAFKNAVSPRSTYPTSIQPFSPEEY